jgi:hypothetical protein
MTLTVTPSSTHDLFLPRPILLTAFIKLIHHNAYSYNGPERWRWVAVLSSLGLLCSVVVMLGGIVDPERSGTRLWRRPVRTLRKTDVAACDRQRFSRRL